MKKQSIKPRKVDPAIEKIGREFARASTRVHLFSFTTDFRNGLARFRELESEFLPRLKGSPLYQRGFEGE